MNHNGKSQPISIPEGPFAMTAAQILVDYLREHDLRLTTAESCTAGQIVTLLAEVPGRMAAAAQLRVPLVVDSGVGDNWGEAH